MVGYAAVDRSCYMLLLCRDAAGMPGTQWLGFVSWLPLTNRCPRHVNQSISFASSQVPSTLLTSPAPHQVASKIPRTINTINTSEHWKVDDDHHYRCNMTTHAKRKRPQRPQRQRQPPPAPKKKKCVTITRRTRGENKQKKKD